MKFIETRQGGYLSNQPELVDEDVGVGRDSGNGAGHVLVQVVDLLRVESLVQELVGVSSFGSQEDAVLGQHAEAGAGVTDGLHGVLHLVEPALGAEDGRSGVVASSHFEQPS